MSRAAVPLVPLASFEEGAEVFVASGGYAFDLPSGERTEVPRLLVLLNLDVKAHLSVGALAGELHCVAERATLAPADGLLQALSGLLTPFRESALILVVQLPARGGLEQEEAMGAPVRALCCGGRHQLELAIGVASAPVERAHLEILDAFARPGAGTVAEAARAVFKVASTTMAPSSMLELDSPELGEFFGPAHAPSAILAGEWDDHFGVSWLAMRSLPAQAACTLLVPCWDDPRSAVTSAAWPRDGTTQTYLTAGHFAVREPRNVVAVCRPPAVTAANQTVHRPIGD